MRKRITFLRNTKLQNGMLLFWNSNLTKIYFTIPIFRWKSFIKNLIWLSGNLLMHLHLNRPHYISHYLNIIYINLWCRVIRYLNTHNLVDNLNISLLEVLLLYILKNYYDNLIFFFYRLDESLWPGRLWWVQWYILLIYFIYLVLVY